MYVCRLDQQAGYNGDVYPLEKMVIVSVIFFVLDSLVLASRQDKKCDVLYIPQMAFNMETLNIPTETSQHIVIIATVTITASKRNAVILM